MSERLVRGQIQPFFNYNQANGGSPLLVTYIGAEDPNRTIQYLATRYRDEPKKGTPEHDHLGTIYKKNKVL